MRPRGTVTLEVINTVCQLAKLDHENIRKEIGTVEPEFGKWIKSSVKEDLHDIRCHGVEGKDPCGCGLAVDDHANA